MGILEWVSVAAGAAGGIVALWALWSRERARRDRDNSRSSLATTAKNLEHVAAELDLAYAELAKKDETIATMRKAIDDLENDLDKCSDPGDVRERARLLLSKAKAAGRTDI